MSKRRRKPKLPNYPVRVTVESMTHDGRGVAHVEGKAVFIDGALPGEELSFLYTAKSRKHDEGKLCELFQASDQRVEPKCAHFEICGGCSLQHQAPASQILTKQQTLLDNLERIGKVTPERVLEALTGPAWGYRNKARLGVKFVRKKGRVLVGFREKRKPYLADIRRCEVLHPSVGERLDELAGMIQGLQARERIAQIEVAVGEQATVLVFRNLDPLSDSDTQRLKDYAEQSGLHVWLQPGGPDTVAPLWPEDSQLSYHLQDHDIEMQFQPTDFTQVNADINRAMIRQALELLEPDSDSKVLDLFCGLGNFTLPLARNAAQVAGVEGDVRLVKSARENAARNDIDNVEYHAVDLTQDPAGQGWMQQQYDRILLDPPRSGAQEMMPHIAALGAERIVYVSCHPGSLARDAGLLVNEHGYRLVAAGVMDMFPHTAHVESMAMFEKSHG
ncbi:23S rRNA (uracil1939-C5)-methyltransferase [Thiogranum longum]|uniref:23S rRNA (uracil(1939)-C(5))-methyltransferase RlmD n=1 Tax=Thiogranum longum TaxID=1537524 RepID=A0A4R1HE58_9GAMM|nr:23S rRNA (uracil(1939)-C(5))-methyltransferase RlmD [Thiogranum longum]TCK17609.1 23S rRNA (uracil1939-C5)-methyltransferase [Thiogranum longum]